MLLFTASLLSFSQTIVEKSLGESVFRSGEKLIFRIHYGFITGGEAIISAHETLLNDKMVFHAKVMGRTSGLADKIYRVIDVYESFFDPANNLPHKAIRNISEGNYRFYDEVAYHHDELYVESQRKGKVAIPPQTLDIVSVMFYVRRLDLNMLNFNDVIRFDTYFSDEIFPFYIVYKGKETISIGSGKYKCFKFVPVVEPGRIFKNEDDMTVWFSDDENKIPVSVKFDILVGSFRCDLVRSENLKYPLTAKVK
ncbi:MAG: DUF3108 domain-containing protein [Bacteroidales bacterium]|nr:DUF3108 domain-containing protein [Bacteroidales bacterium]